MKKLYSLFILFFLLFNCAMAITYHWAKRRNPLCGTGYEIRYGLGVFHGNEYLRFKQGRIISRSKLLGF